MILRGYQRDAIERLRESLASGHSRPVLQLATGSGKTVIAAEIIKMALGKGRRVIFTAPALSLIDQTVERFYHAGITDMGVIQQNHPMTDFSKPVQIASVQTLARRTIPDAGLVIVDEAHLGFDSVYRWMAAPEWEKTPFIGLSATPWKRGMGKTGRWDDLIVVATIARLTEEGHLAPIRYLEPCEPDLSGIKITAGDYNEAQLSDRMRGKVLLAKAVENWFEHGENRPTIAFCVDRAHARAMEKQFTDVGLPCGYIDGETPVEERIRIGRQLARGQIKVVVSVGCLIVGMDWTFVACILMARPTKSHMLHIQAIGRGLRNHPGKTDCVVIDVAGNIKLGHPYDVKFDRLHDGSQRSSEERKKAIKKLPKARECANCHSYMPAGVYDCPACGHKNSRPVRQSDVVERDGAMREIGAGGVRISKAQMKSRAMPKKEKQEWYWSLLAIQSQRGYSTKWANANYREKFGDWPDRSWGAPIPAGHRAPSPHVSAWVQGRMIRYAKSKRRDNGNDPDSRQAKETI